MQVDNCKDEVVIKMVAKLTDEFQEINQLKVREIVEMVLYKYNIAPQETGLVASDIEQRIEIYIACKRLEGLSEKTLKNYMLDLGIFARALRKPVATVNTMDLRMYLAVRCKNLKQTTTNTQMSTLKSFFGWLADEEYIPRNPSSKLKQVKVPERLRYALTEEEVINIKIACKTDREKALVEFLVSTGCRLDEIVSIDIKNVDWHNQSIDVIGKGDKERTVYFSIEARTLLKRYMTSRKGESGALFISTKRPYGRLGPRALQVEVHNIARRAGIEKSVFPHLYRHTFATFKLAAGMPLSTVQHLLGHTSPSTTLIYAEINEENVKHEYRRSS